MRIFWRKSSPGNRYEYTQIRMPKSLKVTVHAKRVESLERDDFVIIYTEYGLQFLRCALSIGRTRKDKIFEIWVPSEDHATFSNQSSPTDATLIDSDYEVVFNLWESTLYSPALIYPIFTQSFTNLLY